MTLAAGTKLGPYEIQSPLGIGGMGEVYRARDTKLGRDVALKILPELFADDPDRLARFQREAQVLASLNHPNIGAIYGLEDSGGIRALVLELVEGPTLADRIAQGLVPLDEALPIAKQIAEALEAAHEQGVIHRDLKPANIKLRDDGTVKVLDFGLAKLTEAPGSSTVNAGASQSPTITTPAMMTGVGMILGTAAYMSPEQAKGRPAEKRSDVWAFGCVLYEMLTGKRAFDGEDVSDTLAAILRGEPDWTKLPDDVPASIRALLRRCVQKDRKRRTGDIAAALFVLDELSLGTSLASSSSLRAARGWRRMAPILAAVVITTSLTNLAWWKLRPSGPTPTVGRFAFTLPEGRELVFSGAQAPVMAISPDGGQMVIAVNEGLLLRSMSEFEAKLIPGSEGVSLYPTFSPDGRWIAFLSQRRPSEGADGSPPTLKRIAVTGGTAVPICATGFISGMSWDASGIIFGERGKGVMRVSSGGGTPELLVRVNDGEMPHDPQMLPDGQTLLLTLSTSIPPEQGEGQVVVESVTSHQRRPLISNAIGARYVPSGHIVYAVGGVLYAKAFDWRRQVVSGEAIPMIEGVGRTTSSSPRSSVHFSVAGNGSLMFLPGPAVLASSRQLGLALSERNGALSLLKLQPGDYHSPRFSANGNRIAYETDDGKEPAVWVYPLSGASAPLRITYGGSGRFPVWSPDGQRVAFQGERDGAQGIFAQRADGAGTPERFTTSDQGTTQIPESWSPNDDALLFTVTRGSTVSLWTLSLPDKKTSSFMGIESAFPTAATFSPDGRWVAYSTGESLEASTAVYVAPFPPTGTTKYQITKGDDGHHPVWSPDGNELFYIPGPGRFASIGISRGPRFSFTAPVSVPRGALIFGGRTVERNHDILPDGKFIGVAAASGPSPSGGPVAPQIRIVLNWFEELKQRVPTK